MFFSILLLTIVTCLWSIKHKTKNFPFNKFVYLSIIRKKSCKTCVHCCLSLYYTDGIDNCFINIKDRLRYMYLQVIASLGSACASPRSLLQYIIAALFLIDQENSTESQHKTYTINIIKKCILLLLLLFLSWQFLRLTL